MTTLQRKLMKKQQSGIFPSLNKHSIDDDEESDNRVLKESFSSEDGANSSEAGDQELKEEEGQSSEVLTQKDEG